MRNGKYLEVFRQLVKLQREGRLPDGIDNIRVEGLDEKTLKDYIFSALGQEPDDSISLREIASMSLKGTKMDAPLINVAGDCKDCMNDENGGGKCVESCPFDALIKDRDAGKLKINMDSCEGCGQCIEACRLNKIVDKIQYMPIATLIKDRKTPVYAAIAPAYVGQFGKSVTPGKLRTAVRMLGFEDLIEVAIFADILSIREAVEFGRLVKDNRDFMITSCCCPIWVAMLRKHYATLVKHVTPSVSPMIASGRVIKKLHEGARVVFIGPCVAKKSEAREKDIEGAIDYVMTFDEFNEVLKASEIDVSNLNEEPEICSSKGGRIYARTGGVSRCIEDTFEMLSHKNDIHVKAAQGNGVKECKQLLDKALNGELDVNFLEGMGCIGGCVGGPKVVIDKVLGCEYVNRYGDESPCKTPLESPGVMKILRSIGIENIHDFELEDDKTKIFSREL